MSPVMRNCLNLRHLATAQHAARPPITPAANPLIFLEDFVRLGLSAPILEAIGQLGFTTPTDIQQQAIPLLLEGNRDFIGLAQTGTGKTAAFGLPLIEHLDPKADHVQALILAPTRELGQQIAQQIELFSKHMPGIKSVAVYGGANIMTQIHQLRRGCQVVIATPGRLIDLAKRNAVALDKIERVILDEADEMLNMGFKEELDTILDQTPADKQTWLFSATMPKEIRRLVKQYMRDPLEVRVDPMATVNEQIEHQFTYVRHTDKTEALMRFIDLDPTIFGVVFCRTKRDAQDLSEDLMKEGYKADALHGDLSQHQRDRVMRRFKIRDLQVLIATDVAARGIDVNDLTHVFHYSLPNDQSYYTHRAGRTARAGKTGISLAFINRKEKAAVNRLSKELGITFNAVEIPGREAIAGARLAHWADDVILGDLGKGVPKEIWDDMIVRFADLSKEELLSRLLSRELSKLGAGGTNADLNMKEGRDEGRGRRRDDGGGRNEVKGKWRAKPAGDKGKSRGGHWSEGAGFDKPAAKRPAKKFGTRKADFDVPFSSEARPKRNKPKPTGASTRPGAKFTGKPGKKRF